MAFYTIKPNPVEVARESKDWVQAQLTFAERAMDAARVQLDDAEERYNRLETPQWKDERELATAQETFSYSERVYESLLLKLNWEGVSGWKKKISTSIDYTKKLLASVDWKEIFKGRPKQ